MTTIAVNKDSIACDQQMTYGTHTKLRIPTKIFRVKGDLLKCDEIFVGFCGAIAKLGEIRDWLENQEGKPPKCKDMEFISLTNTRKIYGSNDLTNWILMPDKFHAIGSGMQFAIAAMSAGKTPLEAVKITSKHDPMTGMGFKEYYF